MIFRRALRRELISTWGAVFTVLFTISVTITLIKILGQAAGGKIASADVIALIGFAGLKYLPNILILTSFISVLLVVTRSYQDCEMVVWFASGLSLTQWIMPVLWFGLPVVLLTGVLSFVATPWANQQSAEFAERFEKREDIAKVSAGAGKFLESASSNRVFFVEKIPGDATKVQHVFVNSMKNGRITVIAAKEGSIKIDAQGDKWVIMEKGQRYDGEPNQTDFQMMEFERYGMLVANKSQVLGGNQSASALSTLALLDNRNNFNMAEFLWRLALPLMCLLLMLFAIPLGFVNPRAGRSVNLIVALLLYVTYVNITNIFQASVARGRLQFSWGWWPVHLIALLFIVILFAWRVNVNSRHHPLVVWASIKRARLLRTALK